MHEIYLSEILASTVWGTLTKKFAKCFSIQYTYIHVIYKTSIICGQSDSNHLTLQTDYITIIMD